MEDRDKLKENLRAVDDDQGGYASKINEQINSNEILMDEMEHKRRSEEAFRQQQERIQRQTAGENARESRNENGVIENEIEKLANGEVFGEYQTHVQERQRLQAEIDDAADENERGRLMAELNQVDSNVRK